MRVKAILLDTRTVTPYLAIKDAVKALGVLPRRRSEQPSASDDDA